MCLERKIVSDHDHRSWNMSRIKSRDTGLELKVRHHLFQSGFRYRTHSDLPGKPDIIIIGKRIVIFVNGCFWHHHGCKLSKIPSTNTEFWTEKLLRNEERDLQNHIKLINSGWEAIDLWQCELNNSFFDTMDSVEERIKNKQVKQNRL